MRIYISTPLALNLIVEITDEPFNHIVRVMRKKEKDELTVFNGFGGEYTGIIESVNKKYLTVKLLKFNDIDRTSTLDIHLIQSFAKFDKMDFIFQKATELGITKLSPFMSEHSSFKLTESGKQDKKLIHWQGILESACEQSGLNILPILTEFASLKNIHEILDNRPYLVLSPSAEWSLGKWLSTQCSEQKKFGIIIGPEGGFSDAELIFLSEQKNCHLVSLGQRILRTETAALAVLSSLHSCVGDWAQ